MDAKIYDSVRAELGRSLKANFEMLLNGLAMRRRAQHIYAHKHIKGVVWS